MRSVYNCFAMNSVLVFVCFLTSCDADLFDHKLYNDVLDPAKCSQQLESMPPQFHDASFHTPEGLLSGNTASLGRYHQCLANQDSIKGKYCLIRAPLALPTIRIPSLAGLSASENLAWTEMRVPPRLMKTFATKYLTLAVCVPETCNVRDLLQRYTESPGLRFNFTEEYCRMPKDKPYVAADYLAIFMISLLALLTIISTVYDVRSTIIQGKDPKETKELYRACSLYTNTLRLLTFSPPRPTDCLDGIRSLSTLWIVMYHTYCTYFFYTNYLANKLEVLEWRYKKRAVWVTSADIAVDSFFTMSGLLLVYTSFNKMTATSLLRSLPRLYLARYLRLFPLLAAAVLLQASLAHHVADGPGWDTMAVNVNSCRQYWWSALLHVQNFVNPVYTCLIQSWYLSLDCQLYVLAPLVLSGMLRGRRAACATLAAALLASLAATTAFNFLISYNFPVSPMALLESSPEAINEYYAVHYCNVLLRCPMFILGMGCGYILHVFRGQKMDLSRWVIAACHILSLTMFAYSFSIVHLSLQDDWDNQFVNRLNISLRRPAWALALCWLIIACVHGYGGPVNWFLSLRLWKFVARISYAIYLFHYPIQDIRGASSVTPVYFSMDAVFSRFAGDLLYSGALSVAMCVLVEEPFFTLQKMLLKDAPKPQKN